MFRERLMTEKRRVPRQKSFLRGFVYFGGSQSPVDCLVRDISDSGARLKFLGPQKITEITELHIPIKGQTFRSKVRWQAGNEIGIAFDTATANAHADDAALANRVDRLDAEIVALRRLVKRLWKIKPEAA
jgi:hypothetical protein